MAKASFDKGDKWRRWDKNIKNPQAALKLIGALMVSESQAGFTNQEFGGVHWKPRAVPNVFGIISDFHLGKSKPFPRRFQDRPALVDTGTLKGPRGISFSPHANYVEVGSNLPYAGVHHSGGQVESMPITEKVQMLMGEWLLKEEDDHVFDRMAPLLHKKWRDKTLKMEVPARPIVGITKQTIDDVQEAVGVEIMEVD